MEEREEDNYEHVTALRCWSCRAEGTLLPLSAHPKVSCHYDSCSEYMSDTRHASTAQRALRWYPAIPILRTPIRGESMGRRNHRLRAHAPARTTRRRRDPSLRYGSFFSPPSLPNKRGSRSTHLLPQASHIVKNATSKKTCGSASRVARSGAVVRSTVDWAGMDMDWRIMRRRVIRLA